ncbi:endonuclease subunit [uncultured Caudovirales phage]|uniref:Endonuclease subunit n=1 Tax=uncultured Caudovirales phage TaxID=2100421 RepID=A0A6J7WDW9_9CAUD|nr:endonuclease subunit [uncultured Caudovirales phage]CAB5209148.1 endonuclease subunit [uncultured Caudovirales phage]
MSVGNQTQAVDFGKENLTLVLGENLDQGGDDSGSRNGTGKTTIVNALSFALFGNALTNIKKDNLINKINNKNMLVTLAFEKDGIDYRVERGRKPTLMKFYVNDIEQDGEESDDAQGDMRETQKDLDDLLGMSHDMFKHIVALNTYTEPFLSMKAGDQRVIIEQLLGITLLSEKAETLKEMIRSTKDEILQESANIEATKKSNEKIQLSIDSLLTKQTAWNSQHETDVEKIGRAIIELESVDITAEIEAHAKLKEYLDQTSRLKSLNKEKATLESATAQAEQSVKKYASELAALDGKKCHACEQDLHDHKHEELTATATKHLADAQQYLDKVTEDLNKIVTEVSAIGDISTRPNTYYDTVEEALKHQNNLKTLETNLVIKAGETDPYQEQIDELLSTAMVEITWDRVNELNALKEHQEFLLKLLTSKDSFIRKKIIDQNLAYLNNRLTYYLDKMGLPHTVTFLNDLNVEITQLGQDLDFDNLSRGERNRLILGLSWAFRDVWESLYQGINLLFVDELIDNGLDASGVESALSVLKKMARERKKNIFLISHKDELIGRVNNVLRVIKENGFTSYANDLEVNE